MNSCIVVIYFSGPRYVALKICKSAPMFTAVANDEIRLLEETRSINPNHVGYKNIVQVVDTFKLISENGVHTAISLEIMGPSLLHLLMQSDFRGIQVPAIRKIIFQVITIPYSSKLQTLYFKNVGFTRSNISS